MSTSSSRDLTAARRCRSRARGQGGACRSVSARGRAPVALAIPKVKPAATSRRCRNRAGERSRHPRPRPPDSGSTSAPRWTSIQDAVTLLRPRMGGWPRRTSSRTSKTQPRTGDREMKRSRWLSPLPARQRGCRERPVPVQQPSLPKMVRPARSMWCKAPAARSSHRRTRTASYCEGRTRR